MDKFEVISSNCKKCGSANVVKFGKVPTVNDGKKQRLRCQDCGKTFYFEIEKE
jgi:transposase-like protein